MLNDLRTWDIVQPFTDISDNFRLEKEILQRIVLHYRFSDRHNCYENY